MPGSLQIQWLMFMTVFATGVDGFVFVKPPPASPQVSVVNTTCGPVRGLYNGNGYRYLSIPYSVPPTGRRRWQPPQAPSKADGTCWTGTHDGTKYKSVCYQYWNDTGLYGSEDCLHLNVWSPNVDASASPVPVMVFIHGGNLESGNDFDTYYAPSEEMARDTNIVYVSINYRLHAFGFMALEILAQNSKTNTSGNYGFMDQMMALKWVQENIHNFGGDPTKVTLFGHSGGATAVIALVASPLAKGLFARAWMLSGSPIFNKKMHDAFKDNLGWLNHTGCTDIDCLYNLSPEVISRSVDWEVYPNWEQNDQYSLPRRGDFDGSLPVLDGYVLPESPQDAWLHGTANDVPLLISTVGQELDYEVPGDGSRAAYENHVRDMLGTFSEDLVKMALHLYPADVVSPRFQLANMVSDIRVGCGNDIMALYASYSKSPVYRYVGTLSPSVPAEGSVYAFHGWDLYAFLGSLNAIIQIPTSIDYMFEANIRKEVLSFVHNGHPHSKEWLPFPKSVALMEDTTKVVASYHPFECSFWMQQGLYNYTWTN